MKNGYIFMFFSITHIHACLVPVYSMLSKPLQACATRQVTLNSRQFQINAHFPVPGTVGLVSRFGKFYKFVDPGLVKINPVTESLKPMDMTIQITEIPKQEVMTKVKKRGRHISYVRIADNNPHC